MSEDELRAWLVEWIAGALAMPYPDVDARLDELGLASRDAVALAGDLEDVLDRSIDATVAWEAPTIRLLAAHLTAGAESAPAVRFSSDRTDDLVAIVGVGCRLPGGVNSPQDFWELLSEGRDAIGEVPPERWAAAGLADAAGSVPRHGAFLDDIETFDAEYFGITPREAELIDPQQRLLLEVAVEALQHARLDPARLRGSETGVFVGISASEYGHLTTSSLDAIEPWTATGAALSIAANRISYALDLRGPSLALDTACSSSLVALHTACTSLRDGESSLALVGGVNLLLTPMLTASFDRAGALAADGRCKTFSADADGIGRGEGCGVVVLKRLTDAQADGDRIVAVVRGSAVNSDGHSNGLTAPNPRAQEAVLRRAYERAGVDPSTVDYVEAHGTGTLLGDPIEAAALGRVLGAGRSSVQPLLLGSVKSNIGHLEAAAGITSIIKVALALAHDRLPATLHAAVPNPHIAFARDHLSIASTAQDWPRYSGVARAGVSGFGFGGTNAHVILEQAPPAPEVPDAPGRRREPVLAVSAANDERLAAATGRLADWLGVGDDLAAVARSLVARPRGAVVAAVAGPDLAEGLREAHGATARASASRPLWVFSGFGQQWKGMGTGLMAGEPAFAAAVADVQTHLVGTDLVGLLRDGREPVDVAEAMVGIFGLQLGLAALWRSLGVQPGAVLGHSLGEVAAAVVSGGLSLADGARVIQVRSRLLSGIDNADVGAMCAIDAGAEEVLSWQHLWPQIEVAVESSPTQCTVAGPRDQVAALIAHVEGMGRDTWPLRVKGAGHSAAVDPILDTLLDELTNIHGRQPDVPFYSTVSDDPRAVPAFDAAYWAANARRGVRLRQAVGAAAEDGFDTVVELAAHPVSAHAVRATFAADGRPEPALVPSLRRNGSFGPGVAALHAAGHPDVLQAWTATGPLTDLPPDPWLRKRFWFQPPTNKRLERATVQLGHHAALPGGGSHVWTSAADGERITAERVIEIATAAARQAGGHHDVDVVAVTLDGPTILEVGSALLTSATVTSGGSVEIELRHESDGDWIPHATATVIPADLVEPVAAVPPQDLLAPAVTREAIGMRLRAMIAEVMGYRPDALDATLPLTDLGFDSLMATRARHRIETEFAVPLPVRLLLQGLTLDGLIAHLSAELDGDISPAEPGPDRVPTGGRRGYVPPRDPAERFLVDVWTDVLDSAPIGVTDTFGEHGGDADAAQRLADAIVTRLGRGPTIAQLMLSPTVEQMADLIRDDFNGTDGTHRSTVRVLRAASGRRPLFVFHPAGGPTSVYQPLVEQLDRSQPVYGLERVDEYSTVETKAEHYLTLIRELQPSGPYRLMGWSLGGVLAGECAHQLTQAGETVEFLASIDTILPREDLMEEPDTLIVGRYRRFAEYVSETYGAAMAVPADIDLHDELTQMAMLHDALVAAGVRLPTGVLQHQYTSYVDARIAERYTPRPYAGRMVLYRAQEVEALTVSLDPRYLRTDRTLGWDATVADLEVVPVPGNHISMIDRPNVDVLAAHLKARLSELDRLRPVRVA